MKEFRCPGTHKVHQPVDLVSYFPWVSTQLKVIIGHICMCFYLWRAVASKSKKSIYIHEYSPYMKYSQNNLLKININKHNPLIGGPLCPYNSIFCDNNKSDYYLFVSLAPPVGRKLTVETMFPEAPCHNSRSRFENSWCSTFLNLLFKQTLQICILPNDPLFHPSFWCTNDLALPNELRCIKPHIFGIFSKV